LHGTTLACKFNLFPSEVALKNLSAVNQVPHHEANVIPSIYGSDVLEVIVKVPSAAGLEVVKEALELKSAVEPWPNAR
jgi:hypothetical protein